MRVVSDAQAETVAIVAVDPKPGEGEPSHLIVCGGVWIGPSLILTAGHCATDDDTGKSVAQVQYIGEVENTGFRQEPSSVYLADVLKVSDDSDLALLRARGRAPMHGIAPLAVKEPIAGTSLHVVGHTFRFPWTYKPGWVSGYQVLPDTVGRRMQVSTPLWMGDSGGGAFDPDGSLVGIASFMPKGVPSVGFFVPLDLIRAFIGRT